MSLSDITRQEIEQAIAECINLGRANFLNKYGFRQAKSYLLSFNGQDFDSKAIVGVAHRYLSGQQPLRPSEFTGGISTVVRLLKSLGFHVIAPDGADSSLVRKAKVRSAENDRERGPGIHYWWVNQNQTWRHEIAGGYLWSPKRNQNGAQNQFYENMRRAEPGDVVFSYFDQKIENIGIVVCGAVSGQKPVDFGLVGNYWNSDGWYVSVDWRKLSKSIRPKALIEQIRPHLPEKYAPLNSDGDGRQNVYLAAVPKEMARILLSQETAGFFESLQISPGAVDEGSAAIERFDDKLEEAIRNDTTIDSTEREALVKARRGQGRYRRNLERFETRCRVTGVSDARLLRASHIKPWRYCASNHERLDGQNGLLLTPHADHLFDKGYISFADGGQILISSLIEREQLELLGVREGSSAGPFSDEQKRYLEFHRANVFRP